jgi:hypothetical protein
MSMAPPVTGALRSQAPVAEMSASGVVATRQSKQVKARRIFQLTILSVLGSLASDTSVSSAARAERQPDATLTDTLRVLDTAIHRLGEPSADHEQILQEAVGALPAAAEQKVRADILMFLKRLPQPGPEFRCSADFVRVRARYALRRLRDTLLNDPPPPLQPAVCYASPFAIDVPQVESRGTVVDIYGFDFDAVPLQMVLVTSDGYMDVTSELAAPSHHHLTLKVGAGGAAVSATSRSLGLAWGHLIRYSIAVVQPTTPLCSSRIETIPAGKMASHSLSLTEGQLVTQAESTISADANLEYSSNKLEATICVMAVDPSVGGCTVTFLYTTGADREIEGVFGALSSQASYRRGQEPHQANRGSRPEPVGQWIFSGFQSRHFENGPASVTSRFHVIRVVSTEGEGCISPIAYMEARRTAVVSTETRQRLDPYLRRIDRAITTLRPRFAPPTPP